MSQPYVGEIRMFAGNFAPSGWMFCDGSLLPISDYDTLFSLIGTTYGGDGQETFALPDLRSRIPVHQGPGFTLAQTGGQETVMLNVSQIPSHAHTPMANSSTGTNPTPAASVYAASSAMMFSSGAPSTALDGGAIGLNGGGQPHDNMLPFLAVNFIISLFGIYPSQT